MTVRVRSCIVGPSVTFAGKILSLQLCVIVLQRIIIIFLLTTVSLSLSRDIILELLMVKRRPRSLSIDSKAARIYLV